MSQDGSIEDGPMCVCGHPERKHMRVRELGGYEYRGGCWDWENPCETCEQFEEVGDDD